MIYTIAEARERNKEAGHNWFSPEIMGFFATRLPKSVLPVDNGALFVSSERPAAGEKRRYTVRFVHDSGRVETVGDFQDYASRGGAENRAHKLQLLWPSYFASSERLQNLFGTNGQYQLIDGEWTDIR